MDRSGRTYEEYRQLYWDEKAKLAEQKRLDKIDIDFLNNALEAAESKLAGQIELNNALNLSWEAVAQRWHEAEAELEDAADIVQRIDDWCRAYPLGVFPEPDLKLARKGLESVGLTMDCVSASAMRHVLKGMTEHVRQLQQIFTGEDS